MRRAVLLSVFVVGCSTAEPADTHPPEHPIDAVLQPIFERDAIVPELADARTLCRRLFVDLLGQLPTEQEIATECAGRDVEAIATDFMARDAYLLRSERHWRDRLAPRETYADWRYFTDLYRRVDDLHRSRLRYDDFAREVLVHPAFVLSVEPPERVRLAFGAFAGRAPSAGEIAALAPLYLPFYLDELPDPDFEYVYVYRARYAPEICAYFGGCATTLFGGAEIEAYGEDDFDFAELTPAQRDEVNTIGRLLVVQPFFYEAAADEILDRLLGWSDGGRTPRRPGALFPEVRRVVADHLERTGNYPATERLVLTSWLYTMPAATDDAAVYAVGPTKPVDAEVWLDKLRAHARLGASTCDVRYLGNESEYLLYDAFEDGLVDEDQLYEDILRFHDLTGDRRPLGEEGPDTSYETFANLIGGCPRTGAERGAPYGVAFANRQEGLADLLCREGFEGSLGSTTVEAELRRQMPSLLGRAPTAEEIADFEAAYAECTGDDCAPEHIPTAVCTALAGSAELTFY